MKRGPKVAVWAAGVALAGVAAVGLVEAIRGLREAERQRDCKAHLQYYALSFHNYHQVFGSFPPGTVPNPMLPPEHRLSWFVGSWGFLGDGELNIDPARAWDDPVNLRPTTTYSTVEPPETVEVSLFTCPSSPHAEGQGYSRLLTYVGIAGAGVDAATLPKAHPRAGVFGYDRVTTMADIIDGASGTMMVVETARDNGPWTAGGPSSVRGLDPARTPYVGKGRQFGGLHAGGCNVLFADGSVRFLREPVDRRMFERLATIAGGEVGDHENP